ncbi:opioid growth factor receptor [Heteronotia binoei]|uniref:opioid growth factor receptor n=1 Tax=Heteronotia binoei TaxID=13085 RepID=UPI0029301C98|nr:opioid growth factor receptor [Heteronotia binoei]
MMMAAWFKAGAEEDPGSEEEEEGLWEYDSTWEDEGEEEEEEGGGRDEGHLEEGEKKQARKKSSEADAQEPEKPDKLRPPRRGRSPSAKQAFGGQERRRLNRSAMGFGRYKSTSRRNWMAAKDMQRYRHHYPDLEETDTEAKEDEMWNLSFYKNEISFVPRGLLIEDLLETWQHDYAVMEENHSYIQWLFPLREQGMNWRAKLLTCKEIQAFKKSKEVMERFVRAYKLMLGFYGIELINEETGELRRADNYLERFWNLNQYTHNNLRITRILKCLGEMGMEHYQAHLVKFFLTETLVHQTLPRVMRSTLDYFMFTVRSKQKRRELVHFAWQHFEPKHEFVWGPRKKLLEYRPRSPELLNNAVLKEEPELAKDGAEEGVEQNESQLPNETDEAGDAAGRAKDNVKGQPNSGGDAAGTQAASKHKNSEKTEGANARSGANAEAKGEDMKAGSPGGKLKLDGKDPPAGDFGGGRTDSECLKESKKRKFEASKHRGESARLSRSPTDIEKISSNLEEVVIDQEGQESLLLAEKLKPSILEGDSSVGPDLKEADTVSTVVKRRKVDEMVLGERSVETAAKLEAEATPFKSQILGFKVPSPEETAEVCPQISNSVPSEVQNDCRTARGVDVLVNSETSAADLGLSSGDSEPDTSKKRIATSTTEGKESQSCSALLTKQEEGGLGQEETGMKGKREEDGPGQEEAGMKGRQEEDGPGQEEAGIKGRREECGPGQEEARMKGRQEEGSPGQEKAGRKGKAEEAVYLDGTKKGIDSAASLAKPEAEREPR